MLETQLGTFDSFFFPFKNENLRECLELKDMVISELTTFIRTSLLAPSTAATEVRHCIKINVGYSCCGGVGGAWGGTPRVYCTTPPRQINSGLVLQLRERRL
jgi:hypothetical protein